MRFLNHFLRALSGAKPVSGPRAVRMMLLPLTLLVTTALAHAQAHNSATTDQRTIQLLMERIEKLEARVSQLEAEKQPMPAKVTAVAATYPAKPLVESAPSDPTTDPPQSTSKGEPEPEPQGMGLEPERMDVSKTLLRIRGFGDISLHGDDQKGDTTSFTLGQLNLFVTSDISEKFKFLGEIVFEGGPDNIYGQTRGEANAFGVDVERMLLQYSQSDYFNLAIGRYHTAIGYYNTAYHHSTWFQTTTGRPFLFQFEDRGGILPIHTVGVSASGLIPSGKLGLHYVAEVGNGRASRNPLEEEPVQNVVDDESHKAFNVGMFVRPEAIRGLQAGFSFYRDVLSPEGEPRVGESILAAHAIFIRPNFEWLNEAVLVRHTPEGSFTYNTPGFYTQISRRWGDYRPYLRYQYINGSDQEPIFPDVMRRQGPSLGLRYDASESVAVKLQYDYTRVRNQDAINGLTLQVGFTF